MEKTIHFELPEEASNVAAPDKGEAGKRTKKPPIIQPWAKIAKTAPEVRILRDKWILPGDYEVFEHLDERWERTVWRSEREQAWKPRDPIKPIIWARSPDWKPKTAEEAKERYKKGRHLEHEGVRARGIYRFFDNPGHKVRVKRLYRHLEKPKVFVRELDGSSGKFVFTDELERLQLNSKRVPKICVRRRRAKCRAWGEFCYC